MKDKNKTTKHANRESSKKTQGETVMNKRRKKENEPTEETPPESNCWQKLSRTLAYPPRDALDSVITTVILVVLLWIIVWKVIGLEEILPGGNQFGIIVLFFCALVGGKLVRLIKLRTLPPLPPLLGMLLAGFLIRNIPVIGNYVQIEPKWSSSLRYIALSLSVLSAALEWNEEALEKLKGVYVRLSLGPCLVEACTSALLAHFLMGLPWQWGFILGFVLGAVSPAVAVTSVLRLQEKGYGFDKDVPSLIWAAGSFDDLVAITGFNICLGIAFPSGSTVGNVLTAVVQVIISMAAGYFLGFFILCPPSSNLQVYLIRIVFWCSVPVTLILSVYFGFSGLGELLWIIFFIVFIGGLPVWTEETEKGITAASDNFYYFLFGLFGAEVSVASLKPETVGLCVAVLGFAVLIRTLTTFLMVRFAGFNIKEKMFISFAWLPKATVQAALGPVALNTARLYGSTEEEEEYGMNVLTAAFLAILITAPVGNLLIGLLGPRLLEKSGEHQNKNEEVQEESSEQV